MASETPKEPDPLSHFELSRVDPGELTLHDVPEVMPAEPRPRKPGMGFWMSVVWCLVYVLITQVVATVVGALIWIVCNLSDGDKAFKELLSSLSSADPYSANPGFWQTIMATAQIFNVAFGLILLRFMVGQRRRSKIAVRLPRARHVMLILAGFPALLVVSLWIDEGLAQCIHKSKWFDLEAFFKSIEMWPWWIAVLLIAVGPGIGEELFCRGFLGRGLSGRFGLAGGILLTSFFFGAIHVAPQQAIGAGLLGIVLHLSYVTTRSILAPMMMHMLNNGLIVLNDSKTGNFPLLTSLITARDANPEAFTFAAIFLVAAVATALAITRERVTDRTGRPVLDASYGHVKIPSADGALILWSAPMPLWSLAWVIVAAGLFGALWMGL